jgi:hypothetical protein
LSDDIQKIGHFQSSHLYGNFLCPNLAHAAGDVLITSCMRESVETLSNTSKSISTAIDGVDDVVPWLALGVGFQRTVKGGNGGGGDGTTTLNFD